MKKIGFREALSQIVREDPRYDERAYLFLREALDHTIHMLSKPPDGPGRHVTGSELLQGIRDYALKEYGPMAYTVLKHWGVSSSEDFGHIVFNLVEKGVLGKTEEDRKEDFSDGYDFDDAFRKPFQPVCGLRKTPAAPTKPTRESRN